MHPLDLFKYCPKCGSSHFNIHNFKSKKCETCGFVYYLNVSAATAAFILNKENQLLVAQRAHAPAKGTLDLPGGFIDLNETAEDAITREIREETGLVIPHVEYLFSLPNLYTYSGFDVHTADLFFQCRIDNFSLIQANDDVQELFVLHRHEIKPELFGLQSIRKAVEIWLSH